MRVSYLAVPLAAAVAAACFLHWGKDAPLAHSTEAIAPGAFVGTSRHHSQPRAFALLPDKGELLQYDSERIERGAYTARPVQLSEAHALNAIGGTLTIKTPEGKDVRLQYLRHYESAEGNWSWVGKPVDGRAGNEAVITFGEKAAFGLIPTGNGEPLQLTMSKGRAWIVETDASKLAAMTPETAAKLADDFVIDASPAAAVASTVPSPTLVADTAKKMKISSALTSSALRTANLTGTAPVIDVVLGYTPEYTTRYGGASGANTRLNQLIAIANTAYASSGVDAQLRLVRTAQVAYSETTTNRNALFELSGVSCTSNTTQGQLPDGSGVTCTPAPVPAELRPLIAARDETGADLTALVRNLRFTEQGSCGVGWVLGWNQQPITASDYERAFAVVSDSNGSLNPSGGTTCRDEMLAHELGHNMGLQHDRETAAGTNGTLEADEFGRFPYGFGYFAPVDAGNFTDIMAQRRANVPALRIFSNPELNSCNGFACGVADTADSARALRNTLGSIAALASPPSGNIGPLVDFTRDGRADVLWSNRTIGQADWWISESAASVSYGGSQSVAGQYHVAALGDLDGNGQGDIVWEDDDTVWAWLAGTTGFTPQFIAYQPKNGWSIAAAADVNGDGKADLIWSNRAIGQADIWLMDGAQWIYAGSFAVPGQYKVSAVGDLDGNGRKDILWDDGNTLWVWLSQAGNVNFTTNFIANYPGEGWSLAGTGDFNGDNRTDLFWNNRIAQRADLWTMNGATMNFAGSTTVAAQYRVAGIGDLDADGVAEVLWEDGATVWSWKRVTDGQFQANFIANHPANGWSIVH